MSPILTNETQLTSYKFQDSNNYVIVYLYATGAVEQKDVECLSETDSLEITIPTGQKWKFQLYEHIYPDRMEVNTKINDDQTQTTIELRLYKQQVHTTWPHLCSQSSILQTNTQNVDVIEINPYDLSIKKLTVNFIETDDNKAIAQIQISQVYDFQVQFTETNFTVFFQTKDEHFLQLHSIPSKMPIKLFVRVKERIKSNECYYAIKSSYIEIILTKEYLYGNRWYQLEPSEYSEDRPKTLLPPIAMHPLGLTKTITNKTIPLPSTLPNNRKSDKNSYSLTSYQKDIMHSSNAASAIGYTGIYNPANSCFMNAAIQCLANTRELRDYFLQLYYCVEINRTNPLGMNGIMAEEFSSVIRNLWSGQYSYINANRLREYAGKRHQEFEGNGQHDAQEFLTVLLDAIHEDLNRVTNKPLVPPIEEGNRTDDVIADEYWRGYLSRNDSLIVQLFTGQFKSKTKCPQCHKESITFDPFTSLSVPLPKRIAIDTIVTFSNEEKSPIKYRILMSADGSIGELKRLLSNKCGLLDSKMLAYKINGIRTVEHLKNEDRVTNSSYSWNSSFDIIYVTETLTSSECNGEKIIPLTFFQRVFRIPDYVSSCAYCQALPNPHSSPRFCKNCYQVSYCDEQCQKFHQSDHKYSCSFRSSDNYEFVGLPFIISLPESKLTCEHVFEQISIYAKRSTDIHIKNSKRTFGMNDAVDDYDRIMDGDDDEEDSFSDIENIDWATIKDTLSSSDSWSICRIGDYFVKTNRNKRHHHKQKDRKEKMRKSISTGENESMIASGDSESSSGTEDFDMLDDIFGSQPLFRIMPQSADNFNNDFLPIVEPGNDGDAILRSHTTFTIDWFTDNKIDAPLRVTSTKHRSGINGLIEDASVLNSFNGDQEITLQQCLQLFIEPEVLGPDDKWYCPRCKEHIQAEKKMSVWRLPPILIIHLKRFKYNQCSSYGYTSNSREKIDTTVKYPIHDLNMAPYCSSIPEANQEQYDSSQGRYNLYGIINHRGTAWFGHYTSYGRLLANNDSAKTEIGWRNFDDQHVSSLTNVKDLVRSDAYVLFYRHRHLTVNFTIQEQLQRVLSESTNQ